MNEVWEDIPGYEGWYQVSNFGNVRSLDRIIEQWSMYGHSIARKIKGQKIAPTDNGNGYKIVGLTKNQSKKNHYVHILVANAFIPNPDCKEEVNHKDYNKANNCVENLEWVTRNENITHAKPLMQKPKERCRLSRTGEKYITIKDGKYRLGMGRTIDRLYNTLEEAIKMREVMIGDGKYYAR